MPPPAHSQVGWGRERQLAPDQLAVVGPAYAFVPHAQCVESAVVLVPFDLSTAPVVMLTPTDYNEFQLVVPGSSLA